MLLDKTIGELASGLRRKEFSSVEIIKECYQNIETFNPKLNAFITVIDKKDALALAQKRDTHFSQATSPLFGLPFVLKDAYVTRSIRTTAASAVLGDYIPQYDATVYRRLIEAGAILIGKMNMDAWGHGSTSENNDFGPVKNPYDVARSAGGSGGGPAAAIASRCTSFAIGEDTGGSIRNPASWCNVTALKVTYGRVSRYGAIPYVSSFDTVGPTAKTAEECGLILEAIAGKDPYDASSSPRPVPPYATLLKQPIKGITIGIPKELFGKGLDPEIKAAITKAAKALVDLGATINEISMPMFDFGLAVYYLIAPSETSSNLARYDGVRYGRDRTHFTEETMRRIMVGTYALSSGYYDQYYRKAQRARTLFIREYQKALTENDILLMPVTPTPPAKIGELMSDPLELYLTDAYTVLQNPVGVPSLAIPCGFTKSHLPIGMQLVGKMFSEELLLNLGYHYQQATDWHTQKPSL